MPGRPTASARRANSVSPFAIVPSPRSCEIAARSLSNVVCATPHPAFTSPMRSESGTRTSVKNTSLKWAPPVSCRSGRTSMPGALHVEHEVGDPLVLGHVGIGAHEQHPTLRVVRARRPDLLAVHDPVVTIAERRRTKRCEVRPGARFAEQLAPDLLAAEERPQPSCFLLVRSVRDQGGSRQHDPDAELVVGNVEARALLVVDDLLDERDAAAPVLTRPGNRGPAVVRRVRLPDLRPVDPFGLVELGIEDGGDARTPRWAAGAARSRSTTLDTRCGTPPLPGCR